MKRRKLPTATCQELNFISSFGDTKPEAINNLENAIKLIDA
jgi:hypothetical protein